MFPYDSPSRSFLCAVPRRSVPVAHRQALEGGTRRSSMETQCKIRDHQGLRVGSARDVMRMVNAGCVRWAARAEEAYDPAIHSLHEDLRRHSLQHCPCPTLSTLSTTAAGTRLAGRVGGPPSTIFVVSVSSEVAGSASRSSKDCGGGDGGADRGGLDPCEHDQFNGAPFIAAHASLSSPSYPCPSEMVPSISRFRSCPNLRSQLAFAGAQLPLSSAPSSQLPICSHGRSVPLPLLRVAHTCASSMTNRFSSSEATMAGDTLMIASSSRLR